MKSLVFVIVTFNLLTSAKKTEKSLVETIKDQKDFKKVLRTKNNVLSIFYNNLKKTGDVIKLLDEVSVDVKALQLFSLWTALTRMARNFVRNSRYLVTNIMSLNITKMEISTRITTEL